MFISFLKEKPFLFVFSLSLLIATTLSVVCWDMNFWPTDAEVYYMPAAKELSSLKHLSQIHQSLDEERIKWLHGKEYHVLAIAMFQRAMHDTTTLRPLLLLGIVCIFFSSLLIFCISRQLWGERVGLGVWFLFASSFWPYLYILFTKHQTQGLVFFLLSLFCIVCTRSWVWVLVAGMAMAVSIFSSTVSTLYLSFIALAILALRKDLFKSGALFLLGFILPVVYATYPDIVGNLKSYWEYIKISGQFNHFFYNQRVLVQWLPSFDMKDTRGGTLWIVKYFFLVMPIILPLYLASIFFLLRRFFNWRTVLLIILSFLPAILAELKGVAQYGANYFPALFGMIMLIGYAFSILIKRPITTNLKKIITLIVGLQICLNAYVFISDIYPCRMVTTFISQTLSNKGIKKLYTFNAHPLRPNIVDHLKPQTLSSLSFTPIESAIQASSGYILLPPISTDSIYRGSNGDYTDFDDDLVLNQIARKGMLGKYAIASFKTLGSSLIWSQEEEILAYRYLVLNQFKGTDLSRAWILDAAKIYEDRAQFLPGPEDMFLYANHVRNIGTKAQRIMYKGYQGAVGAPTRLKGVAARIFKSGEPKDSLKAFIFKVNDLQPMWEPYAPNFISKAVSASSISADPAGTATVFTFDPPVELKAGAYSVVIYRDGVASDDDFYRIYTDALGRVEE